MSSTRWSGALALGVIFLTSPATATGCWEDLATATAEMTVTEKFDATMNCMAELAAKVEKLDAIQPVPSIGKHEKTRAVVAFYADKGQQACPDEWSLYVEAKDRMIVGAGTLYQYPGATGGEPEVTLTKQQMPTHDHRFRYFFSNKEGNKETFDPEQSPRARTGLNTNNRWTAPESGGVLMAGGSRPHNNMPPYIALYFCKKD